MKAGSTNIARILMSVLVLILFCGPSSLRARQSTTLPPNDKPARTAIRIKLTSVFVDDQEKALKFYTGMLGFVKKRDIPLGKARWLTVVAAGDQDGTELLLEPSDNPAAKQFKKSIFDQGIPLAAFAVDDLHTEYERMKNLGVKFTVAPTSTGQAKIAIFDDTCGNLIQLYEVLKR